MPALSKMLVSAICAIAVTSLSYFTIQEQMVSGETSPSNRVIIYFKNEQSTIPVQELEQQGLDVIHTIDSIDATVVTGEVATIQSLSADPRIKLVEEDEKVSLKSLAKSSSIRKAGKPYRIQVIKVKSVPGSAPAQTDWGIAATKADRAWDAGFSGKGIKIAVIDTGIAPHPDLKIAGGTATVDYTDAFADDNGHGTHVAGIIGGLRNNIGSIGIAHGASLYAVKALDREGDGYMSDIMLGMDWAISNQMDIINLSVGSESDITGMQSMITSAAKQGIFVVCSAGNDGASSSKPDTVNYPAKNKESIAVGAIDAGLNWATFSSTGPKVEVSAPGDDIYSTFLDRGYANQSGTSMASPYVSGQLALLMEAFPGTSMSEIRLKLQTSVRDRGPTGRDSKYGYGVIQTVNADPNQAVLVEAAKASYKRNELAAFTIVAKKSNRFVTNHPVELIIQSPDRSTVRLDGKTDGGGKWKATYRIPATAASGTYHLFGSMANGNVISVDKGSYVVK